MKIDCFITAFDKPTVLKTLSSLHQQEGVELNIYLLGKEDFAIKDTTYLAFDGNLDSQDLFQNTKYMKGEFVLFYRGDCPLTLHPFALQRFAFVQRELKSALLYSNYQVEVDHETTTVRTFAYHEGCVREGFDMGPVYFMSSSMYRSVSCLLPVRYKHAGGYRFLLKFSEYSSVFHLDEALYTLEKPLKDQPFKNQFSYVHPDNKEVQKEYEGAFTSYLKDIGAYLSGPVKTVDFDQQFDQVASVVIPVFNRKNTIAQAIESACTQVVNQPYNVIVVDNHSTDGTTKIIESLKETYSHLIHLQPKSKRLGIGGCWNTALLDKNCGQFAIQLDSDDIYADETVVQQIVDQFYKDHSAMVVGSYTLTDFDLNPIAPGLVAHTEWTEENGRNNALRINGFGAPRAFYTPLVRNILFPNVSYGEDYALCLAVSREYKVSRIFTSLYYCRRWTGNSDSGLSLKQSQIYNHYKDNIRLFEILARIRYNKDLK